jgi:formiminoglutamate deiminase
MSTLWCQWAWLENGPTPGVQLHITDGTITSIQRTRTPDPGAEELHGLVLPGLANTHSHAFHRALRGRTTSSGTFWTWREHMYRVAATLDPDQYYQLALGTYAEMALAGITCVGEFHYLHHDPNGHSYRDPNAMGHALTRAAADAGIRITLLDTCYLTGGFTTPVRGVQIRFSDGDIDNWMHRVQQFHPGNQRTRLGAAIHSVRAVPAHHIPHITAWARHTTAPVHIHLSEQRAENEACLAAHDRTPTQLLDERGALGPHLTAIHATHLTNQDIALLGSTRTGVCLCPSTEADLGDGIGPAVELAAAGSPLSTGSDGHSEIDLLGETQAVEVHTRLRTETRGHFTSPQLLAMATKNGHRSLGWPDCGQLATGCQADLIAIDLNTPRLAGVPVAEAPAVARASDLTDVFVAGQRIVHHGHHRTVDVPAQLRNALQALQQP